MEVHFHDKIRLQILRLREARDVAAVIFEYHKSVNYLDLSTNEYGLRKKSMFTKEDIRKRIQPRRQILYQYNLDLPTDIEKYHSAEKSQIVQENAFHHYEMRVCHSSVYNSDLETFIVHAIETQGSSKIEKLRRSVKIIKLLQFPSFSPPAMYLYDYMLTTLLNERCMDPELVVNVANLFNFYWWITNRTCPLILRYTLGAARKAGSILNLSLFQELPIDVVNACFFRHRIVYIPILLRFGAPSSFPCADGFYFLLSFRERFYHQLAQRSSGNERRAFFLLQLWINFVSYQGSPEGLRCIWRSIKDPFLSVREITSSLVPPFPREVVYYFVLYYQRYIIEQDCTYQPSPRNLKDICRVEVRRLLNFNNQLPFGVNNLKIPNELKQYLNLFI